MYTHTIKAMPTNQEDNVKNNTPRNKAPAHKNLPFAVARNNCSTH